MKILVLGSGAREHAICVSLLNSAKTSRLYVATGNAGTAEIAQNVALDITNNGQIVTFCKENAIDFVVVGPEVPLVNGVVDELEAAGIKAFGPSKLAARLEGSKAFTKEICQKYNIPTAKFGNFTEIEPAKKFANEMSLPIVVKVDGLAAGKGVVIAETHQEAYKAIEEMLGGPNSKIVIEEFLEGEEVSFFALCDGKNAIAFGSAQDHKRVGEGDTGPNTGGMGAYSPAPIMTKELELKTMREIIAPTLKAMNDMGCPFKGVLFAGLMISPSGEPKLLEYNTRFGDPETEVLLPRLESDFLELLLASSAGSVENLVVKMQDKAAICVVMAANGYPNSYEKGSEIRKLENLHNHNGITVYHAGTLNINGKIVANGGRVLTVTCLADNLVQAHEIVYRALGEISWEEGFYRKDIGWRALGAKKRI